jgi:hypothetical protein
MRRSKLLPYLPVAACSILYFLPFLHVVSHHADEGTLMTNAVRVAEGELPFRDFFEVSGLGTFYWLAIFFKLLGTTWLASRICLLLTTTGIVVLLFYLARRLRFGMGLMPAIFFVAVSRDHWNMISHHMDSTLFGLLAFALLLLWMDAPRPFILFLAGAAAGLTTWCMLTKGALLCLSLVLLLAILYRGESCLRGLLTLLGGYLLVIVSVLALFWRAGGLSGLIDDNLLWPLANYTGVNAAPYGLGFRQLCWDSLGGFRLAFPPVTTMAISAFLSVPFLVVLGLPVLLAILCLPHRRVAFCRTTLPYWLAGGAFWLSEMHRIDLGHLVFGCPIFVMLAFYLWSQARGKLAYWALQFVGACGVVLAMQNPIVAMSAPTTIYTRRGVVRDVFSADLPVLQFLNERLRPGESVFVYPYTPLYYFLSAGKDPTRYTTLVYGFNTEEQFRDAIGTLGTNQVRYVVWDRSSPQWLHRVFPAYRDPPQNKLIMEPYLEAHYRVVGGTESGLQFLERRDSPAREAAPQGSEAGFHDRRGRRTLPDHLLGRKSFGPPDPDLVSLRPYERREFAR